MSDFSEQDHAELTKLLSSPIFFPETFKDWVVDYTATNIPLIPFHQFLGSRLNLAKSGGFVATSQSTTSSSYGDLSTAGPAITGIVDGDYVVMYGCTMDGNFEFPPAASVSFNGVAASDDDKVVSIYTRAAVRAVFKNLKNGNNNSVQLKYKTTRAGDTATFSNRWLAVIRVATG